MFWLFDRLDKGAESYSSYSQVDSSILFTIQDKQTNKQTNKVFKDFISAGAGIQQIHTQRGTDKIKLRKIHIHGTPEGQDISNKNF